MQPGPQNNSSCTASLFGVEATGLQVIFIKPDFSIPLFSWSYISFLKAQKETFLENEIVCFNINWDLSAYQGCTETRHSLSGVLRKQYKDPERTQNKWPLKSTPIWDVMSKLIIQQSLEMQLSWQSPCLACLQSGRQHHAIPSVVVHAYNTSSRSMETRGSAVQGLSLLHSKAESSWTMKDLVLETN